jgi:steroid delta-isomerase-like uncharacterized protein
MARGAGVSLEWSAGARAKEAAMSDTDTNKQTVRRLFDAFDAADDRAMDELMAEGVVVHGTPPGYSGDGGGWKRLAADIKAAVPDQRSEIEDVVAEGDRVAVRFTSRGTHKGELFGVPASNRAVTVTGIEVYRMSGGKVAEAWGEYNMSELFEAASQQSGA